MAGKKLKASGKGKKTEAAKLVLILGPSGVGKTAVITRAIEGMPDCVVVNFGHLTQQMVGDRDRFRREASLADARKMQTAVARKLEGMRKKAKGIFIVTSHAVMFRPSGFWPGFPRWILDEIDLSSIVLISGIPEEIAARKAADAAAGVKDGRTRDETPLVTILAEQEIGRGAAYAYSAYSGAVIKEIVNKQGLLDEAASDLRKALEKL
ncbi:MAG: AAA family ATPase [archaeon]